MFDLYSHEQAIHTDEMPESASAVRRKSKAKAIALMKKEEARQIIENVGGWPNQGESVSIITNGQSNAGGFFEVMLDQCGEIEILALSTWIINRRYIEIIIDATKNGKIGELIFVLSNRMSQLGKGHLPNFNFLKTYLPELENASFRVAKTHAKVYSMKTKKGCITVSGSGNWSENPRIENYEIINDEELFKFHYDWMKTICNAR